MTIRPSVPEIITVNSEVLQTQIRDLLPSQNGFGSELQASNVITPVIDLTAAAEGSALSESLQQAWDFATERDTVTNATTTIINSTGFWKVGFHWVYQPNGASTAAIKLQINDGSSVKEIWQAQYAITGASTSINGAGEIIVFLRAGDSLEANTGSTNAAINVWYRQVASLDGTLTQPLGYSPA